MAFHNACPFVVFPFVVFPVETARKTADDIPAANRTMWPRTADEMNNFLGVPGQKIPDGPTMPGRDKTVWRPNADTKITLEPHPYHPDSPEWHRDYHWHFDTPENRYQRFLPGDPIPGLGGG